MSTPRLAFYCVTGRDYFPGAVGLVNSLRLQGHSEPIFVCDAGMSPAQAERLGAQATLIPAPRATAPSLLKLVAPAARPAEAMALLDTDLIATAPLFEAIAAAGDGVAAFENDTQRHFGEWASMLGLPPVRQGPYMTTSAIFAGRDGGARLFELMESRQSAIDPGRTWLAGGSEDDPLYFHDQDVFNAIAHSVFGPEDVTVLDRRLAPIPPFGGVRIEDPVRLRCRLRDGDRPLVLHHCFHKPWLVRLRDNVYARLLRRLLFAPDVAIRLDPAEVPRWLRPGAAGTAERVATDLALAPAGVVRRLRRRGAKVTAWPAQPRR